jgi:hypothetical protein
VEDLGASRADVVVFDRCGSGTGGLHEGLPDMLWRLDHVGALIGIGASFNGTAPSHASGLDGLTMQGAGTCILVSDGATGVRLSHVIVRDCGSEGIAVRATGAAEIVNTTLVGNPTAVHAAGATKVRNSLLSGNGTAEAADSAGALASSYNDLFGNSSDYVGTAAGTGDLSSVVTFAGVGARDLHLTSAQPSTDRGDPNDPVGADPAPNGGRINLGAFGGAADAELTTPSTSVGMSNLPASTSAQRPEDARRDQPAPFAGELVWS